MKVLLLHGMAGNGPDLKKCLAELLKEFKRARLDAGVFVPCGRLVLAIFRFDAPSAPHLYTPDQFPGWIVVPILRLRVLPASDVVATRAPRSAAGSPTA